LSLDNQSRNTGKLRFDYNPIMVEAEGTEGESHVIAAAIQSTEGSPESINVIFAVDVDLLAEPIINIEFQQQVDLVIDNSRFVMNAIDILAGNDEYVKLRSRRSGLRTLTAIQQVQQEAHEEFLRLERQVRLEARHNIADEQARLDRRARQIAADTSLSAIALEQEIANAEADANQRLERQRERTDRDTQRRIDNLRRQEQHDVRLAERYAWAWAVCVPPLPAAFLGIVMFILRLSRERSMISPDRRLRRHV
jgi:ABC-2 type transport system permease protein